MRQYAFGFTVFLLILGFVLGIVWTTPANADNLYASIRGTVVDPSGAVVADAKLTATNIATGLTYNVTSSKDGLFAFLQLPIGDYKVVVERTGFKRFTENRIHLDLDQIFSLRVTMEVGGVSETVMVEANPSQVETTSIQLGSTVTGGTIVDTPLNGRNWTELMQLQTGVQASSDRFGAGAYSTNGGETQQNSFLINGTDSNDISLNIPLVVPSPDAIGEFNLVTSTLNPEYGRNSGAIVNAAIKSGTNQFHGDVFEFYRDTFLDAPAWFAQGSGTGHPVPSPFHQNQFGGVVGGPVLKDRLFFFFSYQGTRNTVPQTYTAPTVLSGSGTAGSPTATGERGGDFSADTGGGPFTSGNVSPVPMVDYNGVTQPAGTAYSALFPTGVIPLADLNPLALKLTNQFVPVANGANNLYDFNPITAGLDDQYLYRIDEKLTQKDSLFYYQLWERNPSTSTLPFTGANLPGFSAINGAHTQEYTVGWNHTFSPTTLNELRVAYLRLNFVSNYPAKTIDPTSYGFTGLVPQDASVEQLPTMSLLNLFEIGFSNNGPQPRVQDTYQLTDNFSKVWGHHTLKFGFNLDVQQINNPFYGAPNGNFIYNGAGEFSTGVPQADFLLGIPDSYAQGSGSIIRARAREYYSYAQDQWQVRPNLTLTLGVGWDVETPYRNLFGGGEIMSQFIPGEQSTIFPTAPVGIVYPGDPGVNQYGGPTIHYSDLAPRLGFAWSPLSSRKLSVRAGIGLYYNRSEEELNLQTLTNPPFGLDTLSVASFGGSPAFATPFSTVNATTINGFPAGTLAQPFPFSPPAKGSAVDFTPYEPIGYGLVVTDPRFTSPRSTNFNLTFEYQISKSTIASLAYVGAIGRHEEGAYMLNQPGIATGNPVAAAIPSCTSDFALPACAPQTFPYNPLVYGQIGEEVSEFSNNYNSLQASLTRRFNNGLGFGLAYTWSRNFDYTSNLENSAFNAPGTNALNVGSMYAPSANDAPQRFVANYNYTLPFYKLGHHWKRVTDDWNLVGITTLQHGFPVAIWNANFDSLTSGGGFYNDGFFAPLDRPNQVGPVQYGNPRNNTIAGAQNYWFNPAAFADPGLGIQGTASRNPIYGPGINYTDLALEKSVHIDEARYVQLRLETFNTFNHANFAAPSNEFGTANFGRITGVQSITTNGDGRVVQLGAKVYF